MPEYVYRGRDKDGRLRVGQRFAYDENNLNAELIKEGVSPIQIKIASSKRTYLDKLQDLMQGRTLYLQELAIFARQMQLLHQAGVPIITSIKQLAAHTRSHRLGQSLEGVIQHIEKGQNLSSSMEFYPEEFSQMVINIIQIGEKSGHLGEAFEHLYHYLEFELSSIKQVKSAFRYPMFVGVAMVISIILLNMLVVPTFAKFYTNLSVSLPWQTRILISFSNFFVHYGIYLFIIFVLMGIFAYRYLKTKQGQYQWNKFELRLPIAGKLLRRVMLARFCQGLAITINSGIPIMQGLTLVKNIVTNTYVVAQISDVQEAIQRGISFTQAIVKMDLFTTLEIQILSVGEKNGELGAALAYIANFHGQEIEFDLKRMNDYIGPIMLSIISLLVLILALGIYLPIWNMINLVHS